MKYLFLFALVAFLSSCKQEKEQLTAQKIVDKAIEKAGGSKYENAIINFTFRETKYTSTRKNGVYEFTRSFTDSLGEIRDVLSNKGFQRAVNGRKTVLPDSISTKYGNSLNSVHYFVQLPYGLNATAVKKELAGETGINGKEYYKIKVSFAKEGGGADHEDEYLYWINKKEFTVDYFAYKYYTGKGGIRFREAYNPRMVGGLLFVDYKNYKVEPWKNVNLNELDERYTAGNLELLSEIKTEDISVE